MAGIPNSPVSIGNMSVLPGRIPSHGISRSMQISPMIPETMMSNALQNIPGRSFSLITIIRITAVSTIEVMLSR